MQQRAEVTPKAERIKAAAEYLQSGKSLSVWSEERQINKFTLHNWVEEFRRETKSGGQSCDWLEVHISTETGGKQIGFKAPICTICTSVSHIVWIYFA
jgi:transposase-like protein